MLLAVAAFTVVRYMPPAPEYTAQASYEAVLGFFPRIVAASLAAFLTGSFLNSFVLAKLKVKTKGEKLWLRLIGSTFVGEFFDTVVFALVAFGGILQGTGMLVYILIGWLFKTGVEVVCLPITYRVIAKMKQIEKVDTYDSKKSILMTVRLILHPLGLIWIKDYEKPIQCLSLLRLHISRSVKASFYVS